MILSVQFSFLDNKQAHCWNRVLVLLCRIDKVIKQYNSKKDKKLLIILEILFPKLKIVNLTTNLHTIELIFLKGLFRNGTQRKLWNLRKCLKSLAFLAQNSWKTPFAIEIGHCCYKDLNDRYYDFEHYNQFILEFMKIK